MGGRELMGQAVRSFLVCASCVVWLLRKKAGIMAPDGDMSVPEEGEDWLDSGNLCSYLTSRPLIQQCLGFLFVCCQV